MFDYLGYDWLSQNSESFTISHNAHHETKTTVIRHLLHRERLGETLIFAGGDGRQRCEAGGEIWELTLRRHDGKLSHFVATSLQLCLSAAQANLGQGRHSPAMAA